jgi:glycosyltransferase involved in cell wall biosynthesis
MSIKAKQVYIAVPGQGVGQGGIVRQMQYLMQEAAKYPDSPVKFHWLATHNNKQSWPLFFAVKLLRTLILLLARKVDLLYLNLASKGSFWRKYSLSRLARLFGVPFLIHLHGGGFQQFYQDSSEGTKQRIRQFFQQASAVIVLGQEWQAFAQSLGAVPEKVTILYNSVPKPAPYEKVENKVPQLVFLGHLVERKGVRELLDALAMLKGESWQATIAGSGQLEQFKAQAEQSGLQERVFFPGWLDEKGVIELYKKADVLVLPSYVENQPMCILEAISYELAIIATAVGTVPEMLTDGEDALIIPPQDAKALADAIQTLLRDKELRRKLTDKASPIQSVRHSMDAYYFLVESLIMRL